MEHGRPGHLLSRLDQADGESKGLEFRSYRPNTIGTGSMTSPQPAWDLIIVDEAHRLGGSSEKVARHQLGRALSDSSPFLLLLSATPHQGKTDAFYRLVSLLDDKAFPDESTVTRERVAPFVVRTEKKFAFDADGEPLFQPRRTQLLPVSWDGHAAQEQLYDSVTEYAPLGLQPSPCREEECCGISHDPPCSGS